ncbi:MAG: hypothetical protein HY826_01150 [Actinobacteria bacterium]|nr:hypothetical protein [Actinomycetota bacterium]
MKRMTAVVVVGTLLATCGGNSASDFGDTQPSGDSASPSTTAPSDLDSSPGLQVDPNSPLGLPALLGIEPIVRPETLVLSADDAAAAISVVISNPTECQPGLIGRVPCQFVMTFASLPTGLVVGSVLASDVAPAMPNGLLAEVVAVAAEAADGSVTVQAVEASLSDALEQGELVVEQDFTPADVRGETLAPGVTAIPAAAGLQSAGGGASRAFSPLSRGRVEGLAFAYSVDHTEIAPGVFADGSVAFDIGCGAYAGLTYETVFGVPVYPNGVAFEAKCGASQSGSIQITSQVTQEVSSSAVIAELNLEPITFFVGPVPVVLVPRITVSVSASGKVMAEMSFGVSESFAAEVGIRYNDGFETIKNFHKDFSGPVVTGSARLSAEAGVELSQSLLLYGLAGPQLSETLFAKLVGAAPGAKPLWCLTGGLRAEASLSLDLGIKDLEWGPEELFTFGTELGCAGNSAPTIALLAQDGAVFYPQSVTEPPSFSATALDLEDGALPVSWSSSIDGDLGTTAPGQPLVATGLSLGSQIITATTTDAEGLTATASVTVTAAAGNPSVTFSTKNSSGAWVPVTSISGVQGSQVVVRVLVGSHLNLGIGSCLPVTWSSALPVALASQCDFTITLGNQGNFVLTAMVTDADGLAGSATLTASVSAPPSVVTPLMSAIVVKRTIPTPVVNLCDGCLLDYGETATLRVNYTNYPQANIAVHYAWTVQTVFAGVAGAYLPMAGSDGSPNSYSERTFTAPTVFGKDYTYHFKVTMLNAAGVVLQTQTFTLTYVGPIA